MSAIPIIEKQKKYYSFDEYLAKEQESTVKHEFYDGFVYAMAGNTFAHSRLAANTITLLGNLLKGKKCSPCDSNLRVWVQEANRGFYPDISVICGLPEFYKKRQDTVTNPTLLIEILSPSTEVYDRTDKFAHYRKLSSLREYVLVSQHSQEVQVYSLQNGIWVCSFYDQEQTNITFKSLGISFPITAVYENVELSPAPPLPTEEEQEE
jgi:Uma2 family endonuclease